jgi:hypothetical protein
MSARMSMFGRVAVGRGITTKCDATLLASSQVHPWRSGLHAQLADPNVGQFDLVDSFDMSTHFNQHEKLLQRHRPYPSLHFEAAPAHLRGASETRHTHQNRVPDFIQAQSANTVHFPDAVHSPQLPWAHRRQIVKRNVHQGHTRDPRPETPF